MRKHLFAISFRKATVSAATLAGVAAMALMFATGPAATKPVGEQACLQKYHACQSRCELRIPKGIGGKRQGDLLVARTQRTCNKQYDNCKASVPKKRAALDLD